MIWVQMIYDDKRNWRNKRLETCSSSKTKATFHSQNKKYPSYLRESNNPTHHESEARFESRQGTHYKVTEKGRYTTPWIVQRCDMFWKLYEISNWRKNYREKTETHKNSLFIYHCHRLSKEEDEGIAWSNHFFKIDRLHLCW